MRRAPPGSRSSARIAPALAAGSFWACSSPPPSRPTPPGGGVVPAGTSGPPFGASAPPDEERGPPAAPPRGRGRKLRPEAGEVPAPAPPRAFPPPPPWGERDDGVVPPIAGHVGGRRPRKRLSGMYERRLD